MNNTEITLRGTKELGSMFKITITADGHLRIKIPLDATEEERIFFTARCELIRAYFVTCPYHITLRGQARLVISNIKLGGSSSKMRDKLKFLVVGTDVQEYIHKEEPGYAIQA